MSEHFSAQELDVFIYSSAAKQAKKKIQEAQEAMEKLREETRVLSEQFDGQTHNLLYWRGVLQRAEHHISQSQKEQALSE